VGEVFDPYHRWLGISPKDQPPNHYRLLGIDLFESDPEVIRDAAERQIAHVRRYQLGPRSEMSQRILNELAAAKACLPDGSEKARYDARLRAELPGAEPPPIAATAPSHVPAQRPLVPPTLAGDGKPIGSDSLQVKPRRPRMWFVVGGAAGVVLALPVVAALWAAFPPGALFRLEDHAADGAKQSALPTASTSNGSERTGPASSADTGPRDPARAEPPVAPVEQAKPKQETPSAEAPLLTPVSVARKAVKPPPPKPPFSIRKAESFTEALAQADKLLKSKDYDQAITAYAEVIVKDPKCARALLGRGCARLARDMRHSKEDLNAILSDFDEAIAVDPDNIDAYAYRAEARAHQGDYLATKTDFEQAVRRSPKCARAYFAMGLACYVGGDKTNEAIAELTEAVRLDPNYTDAYILRGRAYLSNKDYDRAIADATEAIRLGPESAAAYETRAVAFDKKGMLAEAARDRVKACRLSGKR